MAVTQHTAPSTAPGGPRVPLAVDGTLPPALSGVFLQAVPHPARRGADLLCGVRFAGGAAHPYRAPGGAAPRPAVPARPASAAPPVRDPATGEWHTVVTHPGLDLAEHLILGPDGTPRAARPVDLHGAPLMPAAGLTGRFVVLFDLPLTHRPAAALLGDPLPYRWAAGRPARVGLLPRHGEGRDPRWFPIAPCSLGEVVNAFDDGGRVVVEAVRHGRTAAGTPCGAPAVHRWTLDPRTGDVREQGGGPATATAVIDPRLAGRRHQLVLGTAPGGGALIGHDRAAGTVQVRDLGPGRLAGRPVFVPRGPAEGDGWVVVMVHDAAERRAALLVLDAYRLAGRPEAVVHLPGPPPAAGLDTWTAWQAGAER
ncbi:hypothetical protein Sru01_64190 [Sphaerisporangium rufum]|uniref:Dioxygenase n=1 Tax=Sphaerisporangium rufum TaxID=1381558 RepID=A0A919R867_9ACTN|nr:carotenoid oxygenase family protein [Sphaerisporangium rufum]GII81437.1 hypothetical protein Sru01_64190 [Sphaerisporangium rufum]